MKRYYLSALIHEDGELPYLKAMKEFTDLEFAKSEADILTEQSGCLWAVQDADTLQVLYPDFVVVKKE